MRGGVAQHGMTGLPSQARSEMAAAFAEAILDA